MIDSKFYICRHCGNVIGLISNSGVPIVCCGEEMQCLVPNTTEAGQEKHLPVVNITGNKVNVAVGAVPHPMIVEHSIQWIYLETDQGGSRKCLNPNESPDVNFALCGEKPVAVYSYCNIHGLWKTEL